MKEHKEVLADALKDEDVKKEYDKLGAEFAGRRARIIAKTAKIKNEIAITYKVVLDTDQVQSFLENGGTLGDVEHDIKHEGIKSMYVADYEIEEVENVGAE